MISGLRSQQSGFTILETIIVLTVTVAILSSTLLLFNGKIPRTQFASSVNEMSVFLSDASGQVVSGYYPNTSFGCDSAGELSDNPIDVKDQGTNSNCLFIGQAIQFGHYNGTDGQICSGSTPTTACDTIRTYTVYGNRLLPGPDNKIASTLQESVPRVSSTLAQVDKSLGYGLYVTKVKARYDTNPANDKEVGGIAYLQSFGDRLDKSGQATGAPQVKIVPLLNSAIGLNSTDFATRINDSSAPPKGLYSIANPSNGVVICLRSGSTNQHAIITLARGGVVTNNDKEILDKTDWDSRCG